MNTLHGFDTLADGEIGHTAPDPSSVPNALASGGAPTEINRPEVDADADSSAGDDAPTLPHTVHGPADASQDAAVDAGAPGSDAGDDPHSAETVTADDTAGAAFLPGTDGQEGDEAIPQLDIIALAVSDSAGENASPLAVAVAAPVDTGTAQPLESVTFPAAASHSADDDDQEHYLPWKVLEHGLRYGTMIPGKEIAIEGIDTSVQLSRLDPRVVADYAEVLRRGERLPAILVCKDPNSGVLRLVDGRHRLEARKLLGEDKIICSFIPGDRRVAEFAIARSNTTHGLRRSDEQKRHAVKIMLADPEWRGGSNNQIAKHCSVSPEFVGKQRKAFEALAQTDSTATASKIRKTADGRLVNTANMGRKKKLGTLTGEAGDARQVVSGLEEPAQPGHDEDSSVQQERPEILPLAEAELFVRHEHHDVIAESPGELTHTAGNHPAVPARSTTSENQELISGSTTESQTHEAEAKQNALREMGVYLQRAAEAGNSRSELDAEYARVIGSLPSLVNNVEHM